MYNAMHAFEFIVHDPIHLRVVKDFHFIDVCSWTLSWHLLLTLENFHFVEWRLHFSMQFDAFLFIMILENVFLLFLTGVAHSYADKQRYDGWYNNLAHPDWGSIGK